MTPRTCNLCRRAALPGYAVCGTCLDRLLQVFGPERREVRVERLSAAMPELQTKGRRAA